MVYICGGGGRCNDDSRAASTLPPQQPPNGFKVKFHEENSSGKRAISCNTHCTLYIYALIYHDCAIFLKSKVVAPSSQTKKDQNTLNSPLCVL